MENYSKKIFGGAIQFVLKVLCRVFFVFARYPSVRNYRYGHLARGGVSLSYVLENRKIDTVIDVGTGSGEHADIFEFEGKQVTRFDLGTSRAFEEGKQVVLGDFVSHSFSESYSLIWISHVLEHSLEPHKFLRKVLELGLAQCSTVVIIVPPAKACFVGGHCSLWTAELLLYHMIMAGFDCSDAVVHRYGYNISVTCYAKKNSLDLDELNIDSNDRFKILRWMPHNKDRNSNYITCRDFRQRLF